MFARVAVFAVIVISATPARADSDPGFYLELAPTADLGLSSGAGLLVGLEGGKRWSGDNWVRAAVYAGVPYADGARGTTAQARLGIERRPCGDSAACGYFGVDLGYLHADVTEEEDHTTVNGLAAFPRAGVDIGLAHVRLRLGFELPVGAGVVRDRDSDLNVPTDTTSLKFLIGFGANVGLLAQF